jgi:hypothetical protein
MNAWKFLKKFSSHFPGGNYGEMAPSEDEGDEEEVDASELFRWEISGKYEINCLACHHAIANKIRATPLFRQRRRTTDGLRRLPADWLQ